VVGGAFGSFRDFYNFSGECGGFILGGEAGGVLNCESDGAKFGSFPYNRWFFCERWGAVLGCERGGLFERGFGGARSGLATFKGHLGPL